MAIPDPAEVTGLPKARGGGDQATLDRLAPVVYDEPRRIRNPFFGVKVAGPAGAGLTPRVYRFRQVRRSRSSKRNSSDVRKPILEKSGWRGFKM